MIGMGREKNARCSSELNNSNAREVLGLQLLLLPGTHREIRGRKLLEKIFNLKEKRF